MTVGVGMVAGNSEDCHFTAQPSEGCELWYVWDIYGSVVGPVFIGSMEECGSIADMMNASGWRGAS